MDTASRILIFFGNNTPIISFFGAIAGGEETLILLSMYSAYGALNWKYVLLFFYLGIMVSDTAWCFIAKSRLFEWLIKLKFVSSAYGYWGKLLEKATNNNDLETLFVTKFLYGFRIPTIMYLCRERLSTKKFIKYTLLSNFVWVGIIFALGWAIGKGIKSVAFFSNNAVLGLFLAGIVLVLFIIITRVVSTRVKLWLQQG